MSDAVQNAREWLRGEFDGDPRNIIKGLLAIVDPPPMLEFGCPCGVYRPETVQECPACFPPEITLRD